nr:segregation/condensation protein A [Tissierella sp.]
MEYEIKLESFEGPLDLLLNLISKTKIDIYDIPIHLITEQYMKYIYDAEELDLEIASDFLVMASTLLEIKSKMLLPKEIISFDGEEFELDPREELVMRILEYKKFKEAADILKDFEEEKSKTYYKLPEDLSRYEDDTVDFDSFDLNLLVNSLNKILIKRNMQREEINLEEIQRSKYTISDCIDKILIKLESVSSINFEELIGPSSRKNEIIAYFLSLLELIRIKKVKVRQEGIFSELIIERRIKEENSDGY